MLLSFAFVYLAACIKVLSRPKGRAVNCQCNFSVLPPNTCHKSLTCIFMMLLTCVNPTYQAD